MISNHNFHTSQNFIKYGMAVSTILTNQMSLETAVLLLE
jgi:hypothetical protein